jgi:hypothetical protein
MALEWVGDGGKGLWEPECASYYGDELVITPEQRWNREQKLALLDWHPMFTGRCPHCEVPLFKLSHTSVLGLYLWLARRQRLTTSSLGRL